MWWFLRGSRNPRAVLTEDARVARPAEAADLWHGHDTLFSAWRERERPVPARR